MAVLSEETIKKSLYEKYIEPTKKERDNFIGIEIEMPIINLDKEPVDFEIIHRLTADFLDRFSFEAVGYDENGNIYSAENKETKDVYSYDCSYNNLELSMGKEKELFAIQKRFKTYYEFIQEWLKKYNYTLSGFGVNPYRNYNNNVPIPNGRYRMLFHHLHSYKKYDYLPMYFHDYPSYGTFCSASQVQLDVAYEDLAETINTFSKLEPIKALIFANSILLDEHEELICCRDMFWESSTHGINPHNIGMFDTELKNVEELQAYIESTSIYCTEREDKYINFTPVPILEFFKQEEVTGEYFDGKEYKTIEIKPELDDLKYLRTFKFEDLTFRGTIEYRSVCCQPIRDFMTVSAFHVGLKEKLYELTKLLDADSVLYRHGYTAGELRKFFNQREFPHFLDKDEVYGLAEAVLNLSKEGLISRGYGEEIFLKPLYRRINDRTNPSLHLLEERENGVSLEQIVLEYAKLE